MGEPHSQAAGQYPQQSQHEYGQGGVAIVEGALFRRDDEQILVAGTIWVESRRGIWLQLGVEVAGVECAHHQRGGRVIQGGLAAFALYGRIRRARHLDRETTARCQMVDKPGVALLIILFEHRRGKGIDDAEQNVGDQNEQAQPVLEYRRSCGACLRFVHLHNKRTTRHVVIDFPALLSRSYCPMAPGCQACRW